MVEIRDSLQRKNLVDRASFFFFAVIGSAVILLLKSFTEVSSLWIAPGAMLAMVIYGATVVTAGTGRLRADQAGDNCYYLGLIYTLISLSHAIFTFNPINTAVTIVQGFGIALATTIAGLVLRVFFNMFRLDIHEIENDARIELVEAASIFKTQINQITNNFRDFSFGLQQSMDELRTATMEGLTNASSESMEAITTIAEQASQRIGDHTETYGKEVESLSQSVSAAREANEAQIAGLRRLIEQQEALLAGFELMEERQKTFESLNESFGERVADISASQESLAKSVAQFAVANNAYQSETSEAAEIIRSGIADLQKRLLEVEQAPKTALDSALQSVSDAASKLENALNAQADRQEESGVKIDKLTAGLVTSLQAHNQEMEAELAKSRNNTARVHSSLVDMTNSLADRIEDGPEGPSE